MALARMPGTRWRGPVPNQGGEMAEIRGVVLHIMEGTLDGTDSWFRNPKAKASSHFGVGKDGTIYQWVEAGTVAWAQAAGNRSWLSIEHEGRAGDALTEAQIKADARILAWAHRSHGVPLTSTDRTDGRGVGWHGMGGSAWGGHTGCPGDRIKAQRARIIAEARRLLDPPGNDSGGTGGGGTVPAPRAYTPPPFPQGLAPGRSAPSAKGLQKALRAAGFLRITDADLSPMYGPRTQAAVARFLDAHPAYRSAGVSHDVSIGPKGWAHLHRLAYGKAKAPAKD